MVSSLNCVVIAKGPAVWFGLFRILGWETGLYSVFEFCYFSAPVYLGRSQLLEISAPFDPQKLI